jgi:two-component system response regulator GlrR
LTSDLVARAKLMDERIAQFNQAAGSSDGLLITGESGAGKELLARAIHAASDRRHRPFVTVNCRISVESWLERELFGPKDGTTDGALARVRGGTLLIDEVGNLPASLQQRFLQEIGNFRLICTTSCGLTTLVDIGQLSKEVYDRIGHHQIDLPPLGRRREDIPRIISHFLEQAVDSPGGSPLYSIETIQRLATADWPENVQRLFELVKQNASLSTHTNVTDNPDSDVPTFEEARDKFSRDYLASNLRITRGNVSQSARLAKRNRTDFYKLLARYRLQPDDFKNPSEDRMFDDVI